MPFHQLWLPLKCQWSIHLILSARSVPGIVLGASCAEVSRCEPLALWQLQV